MRTRACSYLSLAALLALGSCSDKKQPANSVGGLADWKRLTTTTIDGQPWTLADHKGEVILIDFWATWCGPCKFWEPWLKEVHQRFSDRKDFAMVGVALDETGDTARAYCQSNDMRWTQLHEPGKRWANSLARAFGIQGIPALKLILRDGHIIEIHGMDRKINDVEAALDGMDYDNWSWFRERIYGGRRGVASFLGAPSSKEVVAGKEMWHYTLTNEGATEAVQFTVEFRDSGQAFVASYSKQVLNPGLLKIRIEPTYWSKGIEPRYPVARCRYGLVARPAGQEYPEFFINRTGGTAGQSLWQDARPGEVYSRELPPGRFDLWLYVYDRDQFEPGTKRSQMGSVSLRVNVSLAAHETAEVIVDSPPTP